MSKKWKSLNEFLKDVQNDNEQQLDAALVFQKWTTSENRQSMAVRGGGDFDRHDFVLMILAMLERIGIDCQAPKNSKQLYALVKMFEALANAYPEIIKELDNADEYQQEKKLPVEEEKETVKNTKKKEGGYDA